MSENDDQQDLLDRLDAVEEAISKSRTVTKVGHQTIRNNSLLSIDLAPFYKTVKYLTRKSSSVVVYARVITCLTIGSGGAFLAYVNSGRYSQILGGSTAVLFYVAATADLFNSINTEKHKSSRTVKGGKHALEFSASMIRQIKMPNGEELSVIDDKSKSSYNLVMESNLVVHILRQHIYDLLPLMIEDKIHIRCMKQRIRSPYNAQVLRRHGKLNIRSCFINKYYEPWLASRLEVPGRIGYNAVSHLLVSAGYLRVTGITMLLSEDRWEIITGLDDLLITSQDTTLLSELLDYVNSIRF